MSVNTYLSLPSSELISVRKGAPVGCRPPNNRRDFNSENDSILWKILLDVTAVFDIEYGRNQGVKVCSKCFFKCWSKDVKKVLFNPWSHPVFKMMSAYQNSCPLIRIRYLSSCEIPIMGTSCLCKASSFTWVSFANIVYLIWDHEYVMSFNL